MFILRYIVFFIFCFNIVTSFASEVIFEPVDDENDISEFVSEPALNSLHPSQLNQILKNSTDSFIGKLLILGKYFDERYPGRAIDTDFDADVAIIFPGLSQEDLYDRTNQIRMAVKLYRGGKEKYREIKEKILAPKDPPLIVADDEYAIIGDRDYIETPKDEYAVISDFKKVVGYSSNKKEIEAMKARAERIYQAQKQKTNFEKFREMLSKIEFSKIPEYGVTLPNPFVGNAGVGSFVKKDGFKARLISSYARIGSSDELLMALHVDVPAHRFMLATDLSEELKKPSFQVVQKENISEIEIFDPVPTPIIGRIMVGAYRGNFAFPIKVKLIEPNKPLLLKADFTFESCDTEFDCQKLTLTPEVLVEADLAGDMPFSSMNNFIKQSFYNLPADQDKNLKLTKIFIEEKENEPSRFHFEFEYDSPVKRLVFFLENEIGTLFEAPKVVVDQKHIYVQTSPVFEDENIRNLPLTVTLGINNYTLLRRTIIPGRFVSTKDNFKAFSLLLLGFLTGFLFYFTPLGFPLAFQELSSLKIKYFFSKTLSIGLLLTLTALLLSFKRNLIYFNAQSNIFYLSISLCYITICIFNINKDQERKNSYLVAKGIFEALLILFLLPVFHMFYLEDFILAFSSSKMLQIFSLFSGLYLGLLLPDILKIIFLKRSSVRQFQNLFFVLSLLMYLLSALLLVLAISIQITLWSNIKFILISIIYLFIIKYIFNFRQALYRIQLEDKYIQITEKILATLLCLFVLLYAWIVDTTTSLKNPKSYILSKAQIEEKIKSDNNVLIGIESNGCLICAYNNLTVFNQAQLSRWGSYHKLTYIPIRIYDFDVETRQYFSEFNRIYPPLYIFYNAMVPNGVVLPKLLTPSDIDQSLDNFKI